MMTETAIAAKESLIVPGIEGKIVAMADAISTETLRNVSAQTCCVNQQKSAKNPKKQ